MRAGTVRLTLVLCLSLWGAICFAQIPGLTPVDLSGGAPPSATPAPPVAIATDSASTAKASSAAAHSAADATISAQELSIPESARKAFEKGRRLLVDEHRAEDSLALLRKAARIAPAYWQAELLLGVAYMDLRNWTEAETSLRRAIAANVRLGAPYLALGSCLLEEEKFKDAEPQLLKGLELNPDAAHGHYDLSRTYYALGRFEEARQQAMNAIEIGPPRADAHFLLGNILLQLGESRRALAEFRDCLSLAPRAPLDAMAREQITQLQAQQISTR